MVATPYAVDTNIDAKTYLLWEEQQSLRHEYIEGKVLAMAGGTMPHVDIIVNLGAILRNHLRGRGCKVRTSDAKVAITDQGAFFYPDVVVTCDLRDQKARQFTRYPCLIMEVLSPGTEAYDRGTKFAQYRRLATLREYVLIASDLLSVEVFRLNNQGIWEFMPYEAGEEVELSSIDLRLPIALIYEEVEIGNEPDITEEN
ncbi:MAG: Uma2 family endonuclease [Coleofasciculaceae cyanobacterium SM2_1_6]|nr:Uma2 family endonuclease [Coleofasciculaceae cyanobacterium SM2_1_6]